MLTCIVWCDHEVIDNCYLQSRKVDAVYYYVRSLAASNPFLTARESLMQLFEDAAKKVAIYISKFHQICLHIWIYEWYYSSESKINYFIEAMQLNIVDSIDRRLLNYKEGSKGNFDRLDRYLSLAAFADGRWTN